MKRFSQIFLYITIASASLSTACCLAGILSSRQSHRRFLYSMYSSVLGDFLSMGNEDGKGVVRRDQSGNVYTQEQTDSILPFFYMRQLMADERFPDSINGVAVTPREVQLTNFSFRSAASDINASGDSALSFVGKYVGTCGPEYAR